MGAAILRSIAPKNPRLSPARLASARLFSPRFDDIMQGKHVVMVVVSEAAAHRHWMITAYVVGKLGHGEVE